MRRIMIVTAIRDAHNRFWLPDRKASRATGGSPIVAKRLMLSNALPQPATNADIRATLAYTLVDLRFHWKPCV